MLSASLLGGISKTNKYLRVLFQYVLYPTSIAFAIACHFYLKPFNIFLSTYIPVIIVAVLLFSLEFGFSYRKQWLPEKDDLKRDSLFLIFVQLFEPRLFMVAIGLFVAPISIWPSEWSIFSQLILVLLISDFFRYWLHRFSHEYKPLRKFHAAHHAPDKLYTLNVTSFHPVDKLLQLLADTLPFFILGVSNEVMALYFVFYACNGFFQHSNLDVKLSFLNKIIAGPELHRWHHSSKHEESTKNYGNNLIIWDLIFGSYFYPKDHEVGELGFMKFFPKSFKDQILVAFKKKK